jgi:phosphoribosylpyrophosphate synthetase
MNTAIPLLRHALEHDAKGREIAIAFPDEGAKKRFGALFPKEFHTIICAKVRGENDTRIVKITEGEARDKFCIVVDDLAQSGGTLIECKDALFAEGAKEVAAFVTHAMFPNDSWRKFLPDAPTKTKPFTSFYLTNSIPTTAAKVNGVAPFKVLSLADDIIRSVFTFF